ncbi:MAG: Cell division septal protein-like protein [Acidobacteriales bacterium]|nr:Cell division septal protein-like protein [Terriglobales bacterium]
MARNDSRYPPEPGQTTTRAPFDERDEDLSADHDSQLDELHPDDFDAEAEAEPQFLRATKRIPVRKSSVTKKTAFRLRIVLIVATTVAVFGGISFSLIHYGTSSWRFRIESSDNIETSGLTNVTRAQVLEVLGADIGRNVFRISLEDRKKQLEEIPWVKSATVMRLLPDKLRVNITERTPFAFVRIGSKVNLIDASGVVMDMPRGQSKYSFPVITGTTDSDPLSTRAARMKIYATLVKELDSGGGNYSKDLSEVELSDPEDVKVTLEDPGGALVVHLGSSNYLDRYKIYIRHIQEWRQQFNKLESVDLRFNGQIIVNADGRTTGDAAPTSASVQTIAPTPTKAVGKRKHR